MTKKQFAINALRRASYRWPYRTECLKQARVARGQYACKGCGHIVGRKEIQIDHIIPVIDPFKGFDGFDSYIERLFCDAENWQALCKPCHKAKTLSETQDAVKRKNLERLKRNKNETKKRTKRRKQNN